MQVFINICVQQLSFWGHKHPLSRALHNFAVPYLLCEAHSGYDLPIPLRFPCSNARRHDWHHSHNNGNFGTWICLWDRLLATDAWAEGQERECLKQLEKKAT